MRKRLGLVVAVLLVVTLTACAVRQTHAPQITPQAAWSLNAATQLQQLERDYRTLFTDVGEARRQNILTEANVATLNVIGHRAKPAIEGANLAFRAWQATPTNDQQQVVISALTLAQNILLELAQQKAKLLNGGGK